MTIAICVRCGEQKSGAFAPCPSCAYDPARELDRRVQAKTMWLSEHHLSPEALTKISRQLKAKQLVAFDEKMIDELVLQLRTQQIPIISGPPAGASRLLWILLAAVLSFAAAMAAFWFLGGGRV